MCWRPVRCAVEVPVLTWSSGARDIGSRLGVGKRCAAVCMGEPWVGPRWALDARSSGLQVMVSLAISDLETVTSPQCHRDGDGRSDIGGRWGPRLLDWALGSLRFAGRLARVNSFDTHTAVSYNAGHAKW